LATSSDVATHQALDARVAVCVKANEAEFDGAHVATSKHRHVTQDKPAVVVSQGDLAARRDKRARYRALNGLAESADDAAAIGRSHQATCKRRRGAFERGEKDACVSDTAFTGLDALTIGGDACGGAGHTERA
jgi:hypothetical protein